MCAVLTESNGIFAQPLHSCGLSVLVRRLRDTLIERYVETRHVLSEEENGIHTSGCRARDPRVQKGDPGDLSPCTFTYAPSHFDSRSLSNWRRYFKKSSYSLKS